MKSSHVDTKCSAITLINIQSGHLRKTASVLQTLEVVFTEIYILCKLTYI